MSDFLNARAMALDAAQAALFAVLDRTAHQIDDMEANLPAADHEYAVWVVSYGQLSLQLLTTTNLLELVEKIQAESAPKRGLFS